MPDEMTSILNTLYPSQEPSPYALQALFGFGPRESFDLLRSMKLFPTEAAGAEEKLKASKIANMLSEIGIPQRQAEVESFLSAPQALQFFGPQHYSTEGVATYQDPALAVSKMKAGTGLTEAQTKHTEAQTGWTEADMQRILQTIREGEKYGGPSTMEAFFKALAGLGPQSLPAFQGPEGVNIEAARTLQDPMQTLKTFLLPKVKEAVQAGDIPLAEKYMGLASGAPGLAALMKPETAAITAAGKQTNKKDQERAMLLDPDTNKPITGDPRYVIPQVAAKRAKKQYREEKDKVGSDVYRYRKAHPEKTEQEIIALFTQAEIKGIEKLRNQIGQQLTTGQEAK